MAEGARTSDHAYPVVVEYFRLAGGRPRERSHASLAEYLDEGAIADLADDQWPQLVRLEPVFWSSQGLVDSSGTFRNRAQSRGTRCSGNDRVG